MTSGICGKNANFARESQKDLYNAGFDIQPLTEFSAIGTLNSKNLY